MTVRDELLQRVYNMNLEDYLRKTLQEKEWSDHWLRFEIDANDKAKFYIHPDGVDGDTPIFEVDGNNLKTIYPTEEEK